MNVRSAISISFAGASSETALSFGWVISSEGRILASGPRWPSTHLIRAIAIFNQAEPAAGAAAGAVRATCTVASRIGCPAFQIFERDAGPRAVIEAGLRPDRVVARMDTPSPSSEREPLGHARMSKVCA